MARSKTFAEEVARAEVIAQELFMLPREAPVRDGWRHVGWLCPECDQRLPSCNRNGHRRPDSGDCGVTGDLLLPMYVETRR